MKNVQSSSSKTLVKNRDFWTGFSCFKHYRSVLNHIQQKTNQNEIKQNLKKWVFFGYKKEQMGLQLCEAESKTETKQK